MTVLYNTTPASRIMYNTVLLYNTVFIIIMYYQTLRVLRTMHGWYMYVCNGFVNKTIGTYPTCRINMYWFYSHLLVLLKAHQRGGTLDS